jgi:predicted Co/Zn/Cd cation transporter (cation efflux family)
MDRKSGILIMLPLVLIIAFVVAAYQIPLKGALSGFETEMLTFTPSDLKVRIKQITHKIRDLDGYFDFESIVADDATENEDDLVKENGYNEWQIG